MAGWQDDPVVESGKASPSPAAPAWQSDAVQTAPQQAQVAPADPLAAARAAAGPGASDAEIAELSKRMQTPPPSERGYGEQFARNLGLNVQGIGKDFSSTVGAIPDLVGKGTNALGLTNVAPGGVTKAIEDFTTGRNTASAIPALVPETKGEQFQEGAGRGVGQALTFYGAGEALAPLRGAAPATVTQRVGTTMAQAPGLQVASGMSGGGTAEATGNPWWGLVAGMGIPTGVAMARKLVAPAVNQLTDFGRQMMDTARTRYGIPTTPGEQTGSPVLRAVEDTFGQLPTTAGPQAAVKRAEQDAFNRGVLGHSDTGGTSAEPGVLNQRLADEGKTIGDIATRTPLDPFAPLPTGAPPPTPGAPAPTTTLSQQLQDIGDAARRNRIGGNDQPVISKIRDLVEKIQNGTIDGGFVRQWDTEVRGMADTAASDHPDLAGRLRDLQNTVRDAHMAGMSQQDAADFAQARRNYAVLKTTEDAVGGSGKAAAMGDVPPLPLAGAVDRATTLGYARGGSDLNDLARIGQLMRPPPDSGTAMRTATMGLLQGGGGAIPGYLAGGWPGAAYGAAATLGGPRVAQMLYNSGPGQRYLAQGSPRIYNALPQARGAMGNLLAERLMDEARQRQQPALGR